jgi:hypothetical protein
MDKDVGFSNRPPMLDGSNYDDWKPRMIAFLRSLDSKVWRAVNKGWEHPTKTGKDGIIMQIPEEEWDKEQEALALGNSKALNALFNGIITSSHVSTSRYPKKCLWWRMGILMGVCTHTFFLHQKHLLELLLPLRGGRKLKPRRLRQR